MLTSSMMSENYYDVLGISPYASKNEIKTAYRKAALIRHPDKNGSTREATIAFQQLQTAWATLSDNALRRQYNEEFREARSSASRRARAPPAPPSGHTNKHTQTATSRREKKNDTRKQTAAKHTEKQKKDEDSHIFSDVEEQQHSYNIASRQQLKPQSRSKASTRARAKQADEARKEKAIQKVLNTQARKAQMEVLATRKKEQQKAKFPNLIPFEEWVERVRTAPTRGNPASTLLEFLDSNYSRMSCGGLVLDTKKTLEHSKTLAAVGPVSEEVVRKYIHIWKEIGFLAN